MYLKSDNLSDSKHYFILFIKLKNKTVVILLDVIIDIKIKQLEN